MSNFFTDNPALKHYITHPAMRGRVALKERDYADARQYDYAPVNYDDAIDSYEKILTLAGEISGNIIAENAQSVDAEGSHIDDGRVDYASGTKLNLEATKSAGLMGVTIPRRYNGLNIPTVPFVMIGEMIARADAGFYNVWGLQDCAETIYEFGSEEQRQEFLPRVCSGETMAMALTEPDAGSDLQSVMLKATYDATDDTWRLNGVKRFITNGDAEISLVLARTEEGTRDGRGLSMFIYDKRDGGMTVRRIEHKMGINGSPTCEIVFKNAKAQLCGSRRLGLIKYVMSLMNGARLGIAGQSVGISEACYREAVDYANSRRQFGKPIVDFPAVSQMLDNIKIKLDASRTLLYATARYVDTYKLLEDVAKERPLTPEERTEMKSASRIADALTPLAKMMGSEFANQNAYDCIQVHGGSGFMKEYACERLYRDARITSIYEGTSQLQVVAAIRYVLNGSYSKIIGDLALQDLTEEHAALQRRIDALASDFTAVIETVNSSENPLAKDSVARNLVEMSALLVMSRLLIADSARDDAFSRSAMLFVDYAEAESSRHCTIIKNTLAHLRGFL